MKNLLTTSEEGLKKQQAILEAQGLLGNKELFYLEEVLETTKARRIEEVFINSYNLTREAIQKRKV